MAADGPRELLGYLILINFFQKIQHKVPHLESNWFFGCGN